MASISTSFIKKFSSALDMKLQAKRRLRGFVSIEDGIIGESGYIEQLAQTEAQEKTARFQVLSVKQGDHDRTKFSMRTIYDHVMLDKADKLRLLIDPTSNYIDNLAKAITRLENLHIINAMTGNRLSGADGGTTNALPSTQKVAVDYAEEGPAINSGLTVAKLREAMRIHMDNHVDEEEDEIFLGVRGKQISDLLRDPEVTNSDYAGDLFALRKGTLDKMQFMGFTFVKLQAWLVNTSTDVATCPSWIRSGMRLGVSQDLATAVDERVDMVMKPWQAQAYETIGVTRTQEEKVVQISCDQSP